MRTDVETSGWLEHWRDEADAAYLYRELAQAEPKPELQDIYRKLAEVEDRHTAVWRKVLADSGVATEPSQPSTRARMLASTARRFGPGLLTSLLLRAQARGVQPRPALRPQRAAGA